MIIAIFNQAGGVGKTTLTRDLGYELFSRGYRLLLVDADPQGTLGAFWGLSSKDKETFWHRMCHIEDELSGPPSISRTSQGVDIGLASRTLIEDERNLEQAQDPARLVTVFESLRPAYDVILVDCPPKISEVSLQVLTASDALLVPVQTELKSVLSFGQVQFEIAKAQRRRRNMKIAPLRILGIVPTLFNPHRVLHRHHLDELHTKIAPPLKYPVLTPVRDYIAVSEASNRFQPIHLYDPHCPVIKDMKDLADQVLHSIGNPAPRN